ncbi:unnamed protein product [Prunus armeniaca]
MGFPRETRSAPSPSAALSANHLNWVSATSSVQTLSNLLQDPVLMRARDTCLANRATLKKASLSSG